MGDVSVVESAVTRQLQHAILQLCNEHVSYEHTLQVLGVVCVTVDDQPRDLVVKLNNTLKRVDAVAPASDDRRAGPVRTAAGPALWPRIFDGTSAAACSSSTGTGTSSLAGCADQMPGRHGTAACSEGTPVATVVANSTVRRCHGRKQSNPVKVKTVLDDGDDELEYSASNGVLLIAAAEPSATDDERSDATSPSSSPRLLRPVGGHHRDVDEEIGRRHTETPTTGLIESSAVRTLLTTNDSHDDVRRRGCTSKSSVVDTMPDLSEHKPSEVDKLRQDSSEQEAALNFSTRTSSAACTAGGGGTDIKIKDEIHQPAIPLTYGMEMGASFDMARSMSVAAAAAAFSQYADDPAMIQSLSSYDQQRLALYTSLMSAAAASGVASCDNEQPPPPPPMSLLNGAGLDGVTDLPSSALDRPGAMSSFVMSGRLGDRLTMHRLPEMKRRERFGRALHHGHQPPMKVKDIIMFDDSAPLNVQRGSRIEGDFMVDALHVEGRKRRRRTAEDTLSAEEIAEYMGTPASAGTNQFPCRYCGELSADLSRYFAHTLTAHGSFVCHQCGKSFTTKSSLLRHRPIHTGMRRFACSICRKSFYRKDKCKAHIKRHLGLVDGQGPSSSPVGLPGPATPQLPPSIDHQLFASSAVGPVNLAV